MAIFVYKFLHGGHPKYFEPFLKPIVYTECVEVNLMVCCLMSYILHQYISLKSILASALHMMLQGFGNDLPDYVLLTKSLSSFRKKLKAYIFAKAYPL